MTGVYKDGSDRIYQEFRDYTVKKHYIEPVKSRKLYFQHDLKVPMENLLLVVTKNGFIPDISSHEERFSDGAVCLPGLFALTKLPS